MALTTACAELSASPFYIIVVLLVGYSFSLFHPVKGTTTRLYIWWAKYSSRKTKESSHFTRNVDVVSDASVITEKESTYSSGWWQDDHIFQLEQRAIFSQKWMYATHRSRFSKPGDYVTFHIAMFSFFLILGKDQVLRGFHNVCRHRAYEVTRKEQGSSTILGCRYHGWSYDTKGQLTKAPEFDNVPGFDKMLNGLWEIQVEISAQGLVFVNLDARERIKSRAVDDGMESAAKDWKMSQSRKVAEWCHEGEFNWKAASLCESENKIVDILDKIRSQSHFGYSGLLRLFTKEKRQSHLQVDLMTKITICPSKATWIVAKIVPQTETRTILEYELYTWASTRQPLLPNSSIEDLKNDTTVDIDHILAFQKANMEGNPYLHETQIQLQNSIHQLLLAHRRLERSSGTEIRPAARQVSLSGQGQEDVKLCRALEKEAASLAQACKQSQTECPSKSSILDW